MTTMKLTAAALLGIALLPPGAVRADEHAGHDHAQYRAMEPHAGHSMDEHAAHATPAKPPAPQSITLKLPDAALNDQDGRPRKLVSDVMGDRIIVASFVYTSCATICPVVSTLFSQLQDRLGGLLDSRVRLLSLSVDPARDTPARLKSYAESHNARPGWIWLTGEPGEVTAALKGFGTYTVNFADHPVVIMIGDGRSGQWIRYYGFQDPERLAAQVREVLAARRPGSVAMAGKD